MRNEDRKPALDIANRLLRWLVGLDSLDRGEMEDLHSDWRNLLYEPPLETHIDEMWKEVEEARARIVT